MGEQVFKLPIYYVKVPKMSNYNIKKSNLKF